MKLRIALAAIFLPTALSLGACAGTPLGTDKIALATPGKANRVKQSFHLEYAVSTPIKASPEKIWAVLTDAPAYTSWNSTITSLKGKIAPGETLELKAKIAPAQTFEPEVSHFEAPRRMVWESGSFIFHGRRVFTLKPAGDGTTIFLMVEHFKGLMLPMIAGSLPDFRAPFETFAADLKKRCERE